MKAFQEGLGFVKRRRNKMTSVVGDSRRVWYFDMIRQFPLSKTISEVESLFNKELKLSYKSSELSITHNANKLTEKRSIGTILGYGQDEKLFAYLGVVFEQDYDKKFPHGFFFGTDLEKSKLEDFLNGIQNEIPYGNLQSILDHPKMVWSVESPVSGPLLTCVESHKKRTIGLYRDLVSLPFQSPIADLKSILDKSI